MPLITVGWHSPTEGQQRTWISRNNKYQRKAMTQEKNPRSLFFRERLANLLAERGISQRQLAEATKLTPQSISNYMRGTRTLPGAEELYALAKYFDVSMESFLQPDETTSDAKKTVVAPILTQAKLKRIAKRMKHTAEELISQARELLE